MTAQSNLFSELRNTITDSNYMTTNDKCLFLKRLLDANTVDDYDAFVKITDEMKLTANNGKYIYRRQFNEAGVMTCRVELF